MDVVTKPLLNKGSRKSSYQSVSLEGPSNDEPINEKKNLSTWNMILLSICLAGLQFTCE